MKKHYFIYVVILYIAAVAGNQRYATLQKASNKVQTDSLQLGTKQLVNNTRKVGVVSESNSEK
jgi:hypothetical protein